MTTARRTATAIAALVLAACSDPNDGEPSREIALDWQIEQTPAQAIQRIEGFSGPESVRYDPDQDVWFVGNFNGDGGERDGNGFVSRVDAETGSVVDLRFAEGTPDHPLHAPRGMTITGDSLWVTDIDGVHLFDRRSGAQLAFVDLTHFEPGFLNDIAEGPDGALYVTDTGRSAVYRLEGRQSTQALIDDVLGGPNGITLDTSRQLLVLMPWRPDNRVHTWRPGEEPQGFGPRTTPGRLDGVEPMDRRLLLASQTDSSLHLMDAGGSRRVIRVAGEPADIGVDTRRRRVAVPYIDLNRVDVWQLPER